MKKVSAINIFGLLICLLCPNISQAQDEPSIKDLRIKCFYTDERKGRDIAPISSGQSFDTYVYNENENNPKKNVNNTYTYTFKISDNTDPQYLGRDYVIEVESIMTYSKDYGYSTIKTFHKNILAAFDKDKFGQPMGNWKTVGELLDWVYSKTHKEELAQARYKYELEKDAMTLTNMVCYLYNKDNSPKWK